MAFGQARNASDVAAGERPVGLRTPASDDEARAANNKPISAAVRADRLVKIVIANRPRFNAMAVCAWQPSASHVSARAAQPLT
jgi:hypothetical protein